MGRKGSISGAQRLRLRRFIAYDPALGVALSGHPGRQKRTVQAGSVRNPAGICSEELIKRGVPEHTLYPCSVLSGSERV